MLLSTNLGKGLGEEIYVRAVHAGLVFSEENWELDGEGLKWKYRAFSRLLWRQIL